MPFNGSSVERYVISMIDAGSSYADERSAQTPVLNEPLMLRVKSRVDDFFAQLGMSRATLTSETTLRRRWLIQFVNKASNGKRLTGELVLWADYLEVDTLNILDLATLLVDLGILGTRSGDDCLICVDGYLDYF